MFLKSIQYTQYEGTPKIWKLEDCTFGDINLIVGTNATGKSKTLNIINGLADMLSGQRKNLYTSGNFNVEFDNNGERVTFIVHYENKSIVKEVLRTGSKTLLNRGNDGVGTIYYTKKGEDIEFQTPQDQLASTVRRDSIQHPFLEDIFNWSKSVRHYRFGTPLGKNQLAILVKDKEKAEQQVIDTKDTNMVVAIFVNGQKEYPEIFTKAILEDMSKIGYALEDIGTVTPENITVTGQLPGELTGIYVKEADLKSNTEQTDMSDGIFRALSLIIQLNYSLLTKVPSCILIDDIGEGLDYARSSALVKLLIERASNTSVQLIMATNDRFVMNNVPLEYWSVIQRIGNISRIYNQRNSPKLFKEFELTGLNNFDFFSSEYYLKDNNAS